MTDIKKSVNININSYILIKLFKGWVSKLLMRDNKKDYGKKLKNVLNIVFGIILTLVIAFFFAGEMYMQRENPTETEACMLNNEGWERVYPDGTREDIELGGQCEAEYGEVVRVEQRLPDDLGDTWFCMRASLQDMYVYVDGELRNEYCAKDFGLFGKSTSSAYVFFKIVKEDAGCVLAVETVSDSKYTGFLNEMYVGDKFDIAKMLIKECSGVLIISILMLVISFCIVVIGSVLRIVYKKKIPLIYLGTGILQLSMTMITESRVRQFFLPNVSVAAYTGFLLTMLIPYPFLIYVNMIQKYRYTRVYNTISACVILNFVISTVLQMLGIVPFINSTLVAYGFIVLMVAVTAVTILLDLIRGHRADYGVILGGLIIMIIVALIETYAAFVPSVKLSGGFALSVGLIILLLLAACKTAGDILELEVNRKKLAVRLDEKIKEASELKNISRKDTLTGLWNRTYTEEMVSGLLMDGKGSALFMMDLDNFKGINDKYGHIAGDACLKAFASVILANVRKDDIVCRIGGDEFIIFISGSESKHDLEVCAASIIAQMHAYFVNEKFDTNSSVSVGIAEVANDGNDFNSLYNAADKALYYVKQNGKNSYHFYSDQRLAERERAGRNIDLEYLRDIMKRTDPVNGAYMVDYDNFHHVYNFIRRTVERSNKEVQTVLFTLKETQGVPQSPEEVESAVEALEQAVFKSLRRVDVSARYSGRQLVVVLMDTNEENGKMVIGRILSNYEDIYNGKLEFGYDIVRM